MCAYFTINAGIVTQQSVQPPPPNGGARIKSDIKSFFVTFFVNLSALIIGSQRALCWKKRRTFQFNINVELFLKLGHHCANHNHISFLIDVLMDKGASRCRVPIIVVPGNLTNYQIDALSLSQGVVKGEL